MIVLDFVNFILILPLLVLTLLLYYPLNKFKKLKVKEDELLVEKSLITVIFFGLNLLMNFILLFSDGDRNKLYLIQLFSFNIYIVVIVLYNFFISIEFYQTFTNPVHYFNRLFKQTKNNYKQEIFIIFVGIIIFLVDFFFYYLKLYDISDSINYSDNNKQIFRKPIFCNDSSIFIIISKWKPFIPLVISLINIIIYKRIDSILTKFSFKNQNKIYKVISKRIITNVLYLIYGLLYSLPVFFQLRLTEFFNIFGNLFFLIIIYNDFIIFISEISTTKFCEYKLRKTLLGYFCSFFYKPPIYNSSSTPLINESVNSDYSAVMMTTQKGDLTSAIDIRPLTPQDKEMILLYQNDIFIEDYLFGYLNQILNIVTASISNVYTSNYFSTKANEQRLKDNIKIDDISSITGTMQNLTVSQLGSNNRNALTSNNEIGDDTIKFTIKKNMQTDDLIRFKDVLEAGISINQNNNYLNIDIKSFFTPRCLESIYEQKLKGVKIANSLLSHMILNNKNIALDGTNNYYYSLLAANGKEEYFNKLRNTCFKTYDKVFTLDVFDSDNEEISLVSKGKNNELAILLDKYLTYIMGKGINGTFLPSLLGIFKIKINNFKTLLVFVTKNSLVENAQKNFYTYWQMIRFLNEKPQKIASSGMGTLVKDDPIFQRSFQIETRKDNPNYNKISLKNYNDFTDTIKNDIFFLKECGNPNFDLLLMYYEYENTQKHEGQGTIQIKTINGLTEIIEDNAENFEDSQGMIEGSKSPSGGFMNMNGDFLDDNEFFGNNKKSGNLLDINEKVNISSYEGLFDSFNCLCFFTFENVFDIRKRFSSPVDFYTNFEKKILENFTDCKK
jgi:hypothetical protein